MLKDDGNNEFTEVRLNMVRGQLLPHDVRSESVLEAFSVAPRHLFVSENLQHVAYSDAPLDLGYGRAMLTPAVSARMLQAANICKTDAILDVGCGSGYSSAILSALSRHVTAIESVPHLAEQAQHLLGTLNVSNCRVISSSVRGIAKASYDVIVVNGKLKDCLALLLDCLNKKGRLVLIEESPGEAPYAMLYESASGELSRSEICYAQGQFLD